LKIINLAVALLIVISAIPLSSALTATVGEPKVILRPVIEEGETVVIDRILHVINQNNYSVNVEIIEGIDSPEILNLDTRYLTLNPDETGEAHFSLEIQYGGRYNRKLTASFSPVNLSIDQNSLGMVSNLFIYAEGPEAPDGYFDIEDEPVDDTIDEPFDDTIEQPVDDTIDEPQNNEIIQTATSPTLIIGIITAVIVILLGALLFFILWKVGLFK